MNRIDIYNLFKQVSLIQSLDCSTKFQNPSLMFKIKSKLFLYLTFVWFGIHWSQRTKVDNLLPEGTLIDENLYITIS